MEVLCRREPSQDNLNCGADLGPIFHCSEVLNLEHVDGSRSKMLYNLCAL